MNTANPNSLMIMCSFVYQFIIPHHLGDAMIELNQDRALIESLSELRWIANYKGANCIQSRLKMSKSPFAFLCK